MDQLACLIPSWRLELHLGAALAADDVPRGDPEYPPSLARGVEGNAFQTGTEVALEFLQ